MPDPGPGGYSQEYINALESALYAAEAAFALVSTEPITIPEWPETVQPVSPECYVLLLIKKTACLISWVACFETYPEPRSTQDDADLQNCVDTAYGNMIAGLGSCVVQA